MGDNGSLGFNGEGLFVGEGAGFGRDELGVISRRGSEVDVALMVFELSWSRVCLRGGDASSSRYIADTWVSSLYDGFC